MLLNGQNAALLWYGLRGSDYDTANLIVYDLKLAVVCSFSVLIMNGGLALNAFYGILIKARHLNPLCTGLQSKGK